MTDERRDELLLQIFGQTTELRGHVARLQSHIEALSSRVGSVSENVIKIGERVNDHTGRIMLLEESVQSQNTFRNKIAGGYWVVAILAATGIAIAGVVLGLVK